MIYNRISGSLKRSLHTGRLHGRRQKGFSLFIVLMILIVMAFMVVSTVMVMNTESRVSTNDADRKMALSLAETALRAGENSIADFAVTQKSFTLTCTNGYCIPAGGVAPVPAGLNENKVNTINANLRQGACGDTQCQTPSWDRIVNNTNVLDNANTSIEVDTQAQTAKNPRYIIEYLGMGGTVQSPLYYFRVTARAWGRNANTVVTVQSYIEANLDQ